MSVLTTCKTCTKEVAKSAKVCPHCGAKLRMGLFSKLVLTVVVVVAIGAVASIALRPSPEVAAQQTAEKLQNLAKATPVDLDLQSASLDSQIDQNKGKAVQIEVMISSIEPKDGSFKVTSVLANGGLNLKGAFFTLYAANAADSQAIAALRTGEQVQVKGIISGTMVGNLVLQPAMLASSALSMASNASAVSPPIASNTAPTTADPVNFSAQVPGNAAAANGTVTANDSAVSSEGSADTVEKAGLCKGLDLAVDSDRAECMDRKFKVDDEALNSSYGQLVARLNEQQKTDLRTSQRAWLKDKETKCAEAGKDFEGGTGEHAAVMECNVEATEQRLSFLKAYQP